MTAGRPTPPVSLLLAAFRAPVYNGRMADDSPHPPAPADACGFAPTRWSLIAAARDGDSPDARQALSQLCEAYWYPLYAYIRRRGHAADQAQDLTQEFFARLLARDFLDAADPAKGRFRAFLLACCKNFLANEHDRSSAVKRGGGCAPLSLTDAEGRYRGEPSHDATPEKLFERRWALTLLDRVLARLRAEFEARGKMEQFCRLAPYLVGDRSAPQEKAALELGLSIGALKVAVHRLRQRYRELLRDEIAQTVGGPDDVEEEIRELFAALAP
jgi:RNA polymerase sigma-70 factor (ECF subfamily)